MEMDSSAFDIRAELDDVLSLFAEKVRGKDVELAGLVQLSLPHLLLGDSGRFRQVLINLIGQFCRPLDPQSPPLTFCPHSPPVHLARERDQVHGARPHPGDGTADRF